MNASFAFVAGSRFSRPQSWKRPLACLGLTLLPSLASGAESWHPGIRSAAYVPSDRSLPSKRTASTLSKSFELQTPALVTDPVLLREMASDYNLPMVPVLAMQGGSFGPDEFEVIGLRDSTVVRAKVEGRTISLKRLGALVETVDRRLEGIETSVMGARLLVAYQDPDGELVGLVGTAGNYYLVHKMGNKSLAISRLTALRD